MGQLVVKWANRYVRNIISKSTSDNRNVWAVNQKQRKHSASKPVAFFFFCQWFIWAYFSFVIHRPKELIKIDKEKRIPKKNIDNGYPWDGGPHFCFRPYPYFHHGSQFPVFHGDLNSCRYL